MTGTERLKSILRKTREAYQENTGKAARVTVHMGTCGLASGAQEIYDLFKTELRGLRAGVDLVQSGCAGLCSREPMVTVHMEGNPPVVYVDMTPAKVKRILDHHLVRGIPVREFMIGTGCETIG